MQMLTPLLKHGKILTDRRPIQHCMIVISALFVTSVVNGFQMYHLAAERTVM